MSCRTVIAPWKVGPLLLALTLLAGCGGSGDSSNGAPLSPSPSGPPTNSQRTQAATATAQNNAACTTPTVQPFYWEVGDRSGRLASGSVGNSAPTSATLMRIASASKWMFGAYVVELRQGLLNDADITALTMRSGYTHLNYSLCLTTTTVGECSSAPHVLDSFSNDSFEPTYVGKFYYNGGHFQKYATSTLGLAGNNVTTLKNNIANLIGSGFQFTYDSPQLAAGVKTTPADYGFFLRKILSNELRMTGFLGTYAVCTNPSTCSTTISSPITSESWHYSLGHWVEDDPVVGDGAFSSPGAFGFYPWIDASKTYYGILARDVQPATGDDSVAFESVSCGRLIRKAWLTGTQQQ